MLNRFSRILLTTGLILPLACCLLAQAPAAAPPQHVDAPLGAITRMPGDGDGAYKTHQYRDLFAAQGHTPQEIRAKIEKAFQQLFHGDGQEERIYFETGANENGPLAYVTDWANNDARTEGMSYGMMIAVELDKKREFDALWNWAKSYMLITDPKNPSVGYFAWSMGTDGSPRSTGAAPDGEEYFTMALYFAAHRWGNGTGIYNYQAEADKILRGMCHHPVVTGTGPFRLLRGPQPLQRDALLRDEVAAHVHYPHAPTAKLAPLKGARRSPAGPVSTREVPRRRTIPGPAPTITTSSARQPQKARLGLRSGGGLAHGLRPSDPWWMSSIS